MNESAEPPLPEALKRVLSAPAAKRRSVLAVIQRRLDCGDTYPEISTLLKREGITLSPTALRLRVLRARKKSAVAPTSSTHVAPAQPITPKHAPPPHTAPKPSPPKATAPEHEDGWDPDDPLAPVDATKLTKGAILRLRKARRRALYRCPLPPGHRLLDRYGDKPPDERWSLLLGVESDEDLPEEFRAEGAYPTWEYPDLPPFWHPK